MKCLKSALLCLAAWVMLTSGVALAADMKMAAGAGTLAKGIVAVRMEGGFDIPDPIFFAPRLDYGLTDELQVGLSASVAVTVNSITAHSRYNLLRSHDDQHFVSVEFDLGYLYIDMLFADDGVDALTIRPALAYEVRFGEERRTGVFVKAGSLHVYADREISWGEALSNEDNTRLATVARVSLGLQHQFGDHFSMVLQGSLHAPNPFPLGKIGLSWAF